MTELNRGVRILPDERKRFNPGHAFRDGKLYAFDAGSVEVIRMWGSKAGAWRGSRLAGWEAFTPAFVIKSTEQLVHGQQSWSSEEVSEYCLRRAACWGFALAEIPESALCQVRPFRESNWRILQLINRCGAPALDLIRINPALAFMLAERKRFPSDNSHARLREVRRYLGKKQRVLAGWLGLAGTESTIRVLKKIPKQTIRYWTLYHLRKALRSPDASRALSHLPRLNAGVLRIICGDELRSLVPYHVLEEVALDRSQDRRPKVAFALRQLVQLADRMGTRVPTIRGSMDITSAHDRLVEELNSGATGYSAHVQLMDPPVPEATGVRAIRTVAELVAEGVLMKHCIASYLGSILAGQRYVYRIVDPERATVAIRKQSGVWQLEELRCEGNRQARRDTWLAAERWLESGRASNRCIDMEIVP